MQVDADEYTLPLMDGANAYGLGREGFEKVSHVYDII
jgi:hypothetical protein